MSPYMKTIREHWCWPRHCHHSLLHEASTTRLKLFGFTKRFSKEVFNKFLKSLDSDKSYFLQSDIDEFKKYETKVDDEIKGTAPVEFFLAVGKIFNNRMEEASKNLCKTPCC